MTAIYLIWVAEMLLESVGAFTAWRRSRILGSLMAFLAISDFIMMQMHGTPLAWAYWVQRTGKYLLLSWLGCQLCGMFIRGISKAQERIMAGMISVGGLALVSVFYAQGETLKDSLLDAEIAANMLLWVLVFLGWIAKIKILDRHWQWIAAGFVTLIGSDLLFTFLWKFWDGARHLYPLGALTAYGLWAIGPNLSLRELRVGLGHRVEVSEKVLTRLM